MPRNKNKYDFCGWATKNDIKCSDGRTIKRNAFKDDDGIVVPLVWNHDHGDPTNVLGHALLQNRNEGVYAYCEFNDTEGGKTARELVKHGDVTRLSIYANKLKQVGGDVIHGAIKEVSLVLAGANPNAIIENVLTHGDDPDDVESAFIITTDDGDLCHSEKEVEEEEKKLNKKVVEDEPEDDKDDEEDEPEEDKDEDTDESKDSDEKKKLEHSADKVESKTPEGKGKTVKDVLDTFNEEQKQLLYAMVGAAIEDAQKGGKDMKHNVFESDYDDTNVLSHADEVAIIADMKKYGTLKESVLAHTDEYGIMEMPSQFSNTTYGIDALFPDYRELNTPPEFIKRETSWVKEVMGAVHHTPFSRIKTTFADITIQEARALGYMKGNLKKEEVFTLLKRTTDPQTIYKKQKFDRDDLIDVTSFDVVAWVKAEMRMMLDEEIARAIMIGDGRGAASDDKIKEDHVRSIWNDSELFTIHVAIDVKDMTEAQKAQAFIRTAIKSRKDYKGSGRPKMFTTEDWLTDMLLLQDNIGRDLYTSEAQLATKLRVSGITTVPVFENQTREVSGVTYTLGAIIVNLNDYNVGADKGGAVNLFDDFDIDYNQKAD